MPLPNLEQILPRFEVVIPSTQQSTMFRPFLVKEEKLLLIALESEDEKQMLDAIIQVVTSCALVPIKAEDLANFDLEYIFLQLRAKSVDGNVVLNYRCHNLIELSEDQAEKRKTQFVPEKKVSCDNVVKVTISLDDVNIQFKPEHTKQIFLNETLGVNMRYPSCKTAKQLIRTNTKDRIDESLLSVAMCVESVFDEQSVYNNFTTKEIQDWIEKLTQAQYVKLNAFFETMPVLAHDMEFFCPKCGYKEPLHIEGLQAFFG